uniref:Uncharacterized protein n=1 Tax=Arundo donax TaxID=35708 RepID=A0A0A9DBD8_ARUDO
MSSVLRLCLANMAERSLTRMSGPGSLPATSPDLETSPSSRPSSTAQWGPDDMLTTSLAAMARMSAQETTPGHLFSTSALARTTVSKPSPARDTLSGASFSASLSWDAIMTDASQPCK